MKTLNLTDNEATFLKQAFEYYNLCVININVPTKQAFEMLGNDDAKTINPFIEQLSNKIDKL